MQIFTTASSNADTVVYTDKGIAVIEGIKFSKAYVDDVVEKCETFLLKSVLPELLSRKIDSNFKEQNINTFAKC